jgi:hypothetical protein
VHQPRGVGLIHPRLRPSNAYYTHDSGRCRKFLFQLKVTLSRKNTDGPARHSGLSGRFAHDIAAPSDRRPMLCP